MNKRNNSKSKKSSTTKEDLDTPLVLSSSNPVVLTDGEEEKKNTSNNLKVPENWVDVISGGAYVKANPIGKDVKRSVSHYGNMKVKKTKDLLKGAAKMRTPHAPKMKMLNALLQKETVPLQATGGHKSYGNLKENTIGLCRRTRNYFGWCCTRACFLRIPEKAVVRKNIPHDYLRYWFHTLLTMHPIWQIIAIFFAYFSVNGIFAFLYSLGGSDSIRGWEHSGDFFWLSVQTLTTVGYGRLEPRTAYTHLVASVEATIGVMLLAVCSGLAYSIIARPSSRILFSKVAIIEPVIATTNMRRLHVRIANLRDTSSLYDVQLHIFLAYMDLDEVNGGLKYTVERLKLNEEGHHARITVGISYFHDIDEESPFHRIHSQDWLVKHQARLQCVITCHDGDWCTTTATHKIYEATSIHFGHLFHNLALTTQDKPGTFYMDYSKFHKTKNINEIVNKLFATLDDNNDGVVSRDSLERYAENPIQEFQSDLSFEPSYLLDHFDEVKREGLNGIDKESFAHAIFLLRKQQRDLRKIGTLV